MLKGIGLPELAAKLETARNDTREFVAATRNVAMTIAEDGKTPRLEIGGEGAFNVMPLAHSQIGARTNIPAKYYDRMLADAPDLLAANVNRWFRQNPEKRMFRTLRDSNRAVLSNRFQRIEHEHIAEAAFPVLADLKGVQITSC